MEEKAELNKEIDCNMIIDQYYLNEPAIVKRNDGTVREMPSLHDIFFPLTTDLGETFTDRCDCMSPKKVKVGLRE